MTTTYVLIILVTFYKVSQGSFIATIESLLLYSPDFPFLRKEGILFGSKIFIPIQSSFLGSNGD